MSGDVHSGGAIDDGTHATWPEISVPHANMPNNWINTFCEVFDHGKSARSQPGLWTIGTLVEPDFDAAREADLRRRPAAAGAILVYPPRGVYASTGKGHPGYVRVDATPTSLSATVIGAGRQSALRRQRADGSSVPDRRCNSPPNEDRSP